MSKEPVIMAPWLKTKEEQSVGCNGEGGEDLGNETL